MRPKVSGPGSAGNRPGPGNPAAVAAAPLPATNPAPEPSVVPEPAFALAPATRQRAGSGSAAVSGPPAGARRASVTGSEAGTQRASAFSAVQENVQSVPDNSDASRTRFISQGPPFGPRASGLGTGKAMSILQTPAAYIGQRAGVSGPERAAFIRELEEGKLGPGAPGGGLVGLGQQQGGGGPVGSRRPLALSPTPPPTLAKSRSAAPLRSRLPRILPRFSRSQTSVGGSGPGAPSSRLLLRQTRALSVPPRRATAVPGEGRGAACRRCRVPSEPALARGASDGKVSGQKERFCQGRDQDPASPLKHSWRWAEPQTEAASPPASSPLFWGAGAPQIVSSGSGGPSPSAREVSSFSPRATCAAGVTASDFVSREAPVSWPGLPSG